MLTKLEEELLNSCVGVVYLIINKLNGFFYVGETILKGKKFENYWGSGTLIIDKLLKDKESSLTGYGKDIKSQKKIFVR